LQDASASGRKELQTESPEYGVYLLAIYLNISKNQQNIKQISCQWRNLLTSENQKVIWNPLTPTLSLQGRGEK
jgi:hypothetical protein